MNEKDPIKDCLIPSGTQGGLIFNVVFDVEQMMNEYKYDFDKPFLENCLSQFGRYYWVSEENYDNSCVTTKSCQPTYLEKLKSSSCLESAKYMSGSSFLYRQVCIACNSTNFVFRLFLQ